MRGAGAVAHVRIRIQDRHRFVFGLTPILSSLVFVLATRFQYGGGLFDSNMILSDLLRQAYQSYTWSSKFVPHNFEISRQCDFIFTTGIQIAHPGCRGEPLCKVYQANRCFAVTTHRHESS